MSIVLSGTINHMIIRESKKTPSLKGRGKGINYRKSTLEVENRDVFGLKVTSNDKCNDIKVYVLLKLK